MTRVEEDITLCEEIIPPSFSQEDVEDVIDKINNPIEVESLNKRIKTTKAISEEDKFKIIEENVDRILGHHKKDSYIIRTREELTYYIDEAIKNKLIAVDTETNNSLDPITCKIMGICLYTPTLKQVYIPINHVDFYTKERLSWQLTEKDLQEELSRLLKEVKIIFHNGKFDYKVIKCTCNVELPINEDTMLGARILDENESASLKWQYIDKINNDQEKYSLENLFEHEKYELFKPEVFSLYASTDALMTKQLYDYQCNEFEKEENKKLYDLYENIELPISRVTADIELRGVSVDLPYLRKLQKKYYRLQEEVQKKIDIEIENLKPKIDRWRKTKGASNPIYYFITRDEWLTSELCTWTLFKDKIEDCNKWLKRSEKTFDRFLFEDEEFKVVETLSKKIYLLHYKNNQLTEIHKLKVTKSKSDKLDYPPNLSSSTQLAILLYDVLKIQPIDKSEPRATGSEELEAIAKRDNILLCKLLTEYKNYEKLITSFLDAIPKFINEKTGRVHCNFNQYGTKTGRYSSTEPNLQQIPSHNVEIRKLFVAGSKEKEKEVLDDNVVLNKYDEVYTTEGFKEVNSLNIGDILINNDTTLKIKSINNQEDYVKIFFVI